MHVFLATDGSGPAQSAREQILAMPWRCPLNVTVMTVVPDPPPQTALLPAGRHENGVQATRARRDTMDRARALLDATRDTFQGKVASVATRVHEGTPGLKVVEMARACRADLVAVGTLGSGTYKGVFLGSVSDYVVSHARSSVLVARPHPGWMRRYMVALDDSENAASVVRWLGELDLSGGASVHLVKVYHSLKEFPFPDDEYDEVTNGDSIADKLAAGNSSPEVVEALRAQGLGPPSCRVTVEVRFGPEGPEILAALRDFQPDLLVIGAKGRNTHPDWPLGGVAQYLVDHAPCSVLVVRAPGRKPLQNSFR